MRLALGLSQSGQQWVVNAYTLTFAGFLLLGGRAADIFGRRLVFMAGLALFTVCSLLGGLATSGTELILARAAQGLGGAVLAPATLSLLTTNFTAPDERRKALGAWSATAASGAAIGVLLGGILTQAINWRWVLFVNVPIGIVLLVVCGLGVAESKGTGVRSLDIAGALTVTAGLAALVYGIVGTNTNAWGSAHTVTALAAGAALLALFVYIEARVATQPLMPLGIFRHRNLSVANGIAVVLGAALFGMYFFLSLYLQEVNGYDALKGGLAYLPAGLSTLTGALIGSRLVARIGPGRQLLLGPGLATVGLIWLANLNAGDAYLAHVFGPLVLVGFGLGLSFVPMTMAATAGLPPQQAGLAAGLINTTRQMGGALGLAAMATVANTVAHSGLAPHHLPSAHALTDGYDWAFAISAVCLGTAALLALMLPNRTPAQGLAAQGASVPQQPERSGAPEPALATGS
jgi:EmrB/QacA subfamily drug resistance transporter